MSSDTLTLIVNKWREVCDNILVQKDHVDLLFSSSTLFLNNVASWVIEGVCSENTDSV